MAARRVLPGVNPPYAPLFCRCMLMLMRRGVGRARVVERTCFECGETWTLDARVAKVSTPGRRRRFPLGVILGAQRDLSLYRPYVHPQMMDARGHQSDLDRELELIRSVGRCRMCGSDHYIEQAV